MLIQRQIIDDLRKWQVSEKRKPLILQGARQVGKTWILKYFGQLHFENTAYFNFEEQAEIKELFEKTKDVKRIIEYLSLIHGKNISPEKTLIIFDEIQECNDALNSLKYFCENAPEYAIASAGSLLGVALAKGASFPVGKVNFLTMFPVTFIEFLSISDKQLADFLLNKQDLSPIPELLFSKIVDKFKMYFISGGMPEAISEIIETGNIEKIQQILQSIINAFNFDFSKHTTTYLIPKLTYLWNSIPSQLSKENKKFIYQVVKSGARAREYEDGLLWLSQAGLIYKIHCTSKPGLPLSAYDDMSSFKVYLCDVGILRKLAGLHPSVIIEGSRLFSEFKGALTENFILQSLKPQFEQMPRYWTSGNKAEIDFLIQFKNEIIPVEVKSDENIKSRSLTLYQQQYQPSLRIRFSMRNLKKTDNLINIPLFMADLTSKIITENI